MTRIQNNPIATILIGSGIVHSAHFTRAQMHQNTMQATATLKRSSCQPVNAIIASVVMVFLSFLLVAQPPLGVDFLLR